MSQGLLNNFFNLYLFDNLNNTTIQIHLASSPFEHLMSDCDTYRLIFLYVTRLLFAKHLQHKFIEFFKQIIKTIYLASWPFDLWRSKHLWCTQTDILNRSQGFFSQNTIFFFKHIIKLIYSLSTVIYKIYTNVKGWWRGMKKYKWMKKFSSVPLVFALGTISMRVR